LIDQLPAPLVPPDVDLRAAAASVGQRRYFSGKPCPVGHTGPRDTLLAECCQCRALWRKAQKQRDRAKLKGAAR
jgi:hypothetical protein